ncbi:MAG TPA: hypothetical protein ACFCUY_02235 [Xenococcaceae cyanobacterium]
MPTDKQYKNGRSSKQGYTFGKNQPIHIEQMFETIAQEQEDERY